MDKRKLQSIQEESGVSQSTGIVERQRGSTVSSTNSKMAYNYTHVKTDPSITDSITVDSGERELVYNFHITGSITVVKLSGSSTESNISCDSSNLFRIETSSEGCEYEIRINGVVNFLSKSETTGEGNDFHESDKSAILVCKSSDFSSRPITRDSLSTLVPQTSSFTNTMITSSLELEATDCSAEGLSNTEEIAGSSTLHSKFISLPEIKAEIGSNFDDICSSNHTKTLCNSKSIVRTSTANTHEEPSLCVRLLGNSDALYSKGKRNTNRNSSSEHSTDGQDRPKGPPDSVQVKVQSSSISRVSSKNDSIQSHFPKKQLFHCALCGFTCSWKRALQSHLDAHLSNTYDGSVKRMKLCRRKPKISLPCCLCRKIYKSPLLFVCHLQDCHREDKIFSCSVCDFFGEEMGSLTEHVQSEHMHMDKYYCYSCSIQYDTLDQLFQHISVIHAEKKLQSCVLCSFVCPTANGMKEHTIKFHAQRDKSLDPFFCAFCDFSTDALINLRKHQQSQHTGESPLLCSKCGLCFETIKALKLHEAVHAKEKRQCPKCGFVCKNLGALNSHMIKHSEFKPYVCQHCERKFKYKAHLDLHTAGIHSKRSFRCPCGDSFKTGFLLKAHVKKMHNAANPISCSLCSYTTKSINLLKYHRIRMHAKEDLYSCTRCDYTCKLQCDFNEHMKNKHNKEKQKQFQCDQCNFSTKLRYCLKRHVQRKHAKGKSVACPICKVVFKSELSLDNHMGTNSDEKPLRCHLCGISTKIASCLQRHMRAKHSKQRPFACTQCECNYTCMSTLYKHIQSKHKAK